MTTCAAALAGAAQTASSGAFTLRGTVTYVVDGDTVHVAVAGRDEKVRLIGIDTPEVGQCDATKATALARRLAQGRPVKLVGDSTQDPRDRYGRLLAYVVLPNNRDLGYPGSRARSRTRLHRRPPGPAPCHVQACRAGRTQARRQPLAWLRYGASVVQSLRSVVARTTSTGTTTASAGEK
ncbi:MAG: thermonuclease family protein [Actinomycetota bacterium]